MIEKIIDNWLTKSSERSYQLPFCYMLVQEGYTVIHLTRHCGMEFGKDIIAIDPNKIPCAYQLKDVKGGKYKLRDWKDNIDQIYQMVLTPLEHPSVPSHKQHRSFLVINGDIEEEVSAAISLQNLKWERQGEKYKIEVIVKGQLLKMALKNKDQFIPSELFDFKSLLEFQLNDGVGFLDKEKFAGLIGSIIEKEKVTTPEGKRLVSSAALLCSLALSNYSKLNNHVAVIEGWVIYQAFVLGFAEKKGKRIDTFLDELNLADTLINFSLLDLADEINDHSYLLVGDLNQDAFVYKYRVTILMGLVAYLGIKSRFNESVIVDRKSILQILQRFEVHMDVWGEAAVPFFLNIYWFYILEGEKDQAHRIIFLLLNLILNYGSDPVIMLTNVYYSAESTMLQLLEGKREANLAIIQHRGSFVLETILHLVTKEELKESVKSFWSLISKFYFEEFQMDNAEDFYLWRIAKGKTITKHLSEMKKWSELFKEANHVIESDIPTTLKNYRQYIPLFLMVYPHRLNRNLVMWIDQIYVSQ